MKKYLEINETKDFLSYTHHSFVDSIINRKEIASIYIKDYDSKEWSILDTDINYEFDDKTNIIFLSERENRKSVSLELVRKCRAIDEIVIKISDFNLVDSLSNVMCSIIDDLETTESLFSFYWNQYDITIKEEKYKYENHFNMFYKIEVVEDDICILISYDMIIWKELYRTHIDKKSSADEYFSVKIYFGDNQYENWKNMNFLQLFYHENDYNGVYLDYYVCPRKGIDASYGNACQFLDTEYIDYDILSKNIHSYIESSVESEYYLSIFLNEYYIPNRKAYMSYDYNHYNLILGYDTEKQEYKILGYNSIGKLCCSTISYETLETALYPNEVIRYHYKVNSYQYKFNVRFIKNAIREFLLSEDSSYRFANILTSEEGVYGISIFDKLLNTIKGRQLILDDRRVSYVLYEHANLNKKRLIYLINHGYIKENYIDQLTLQAKEILLVAEIVKNYVIKNILFPLDSSKIFRNLTKMKELENDFFNTLLEGFRD